MKSEENKKIQATFKRDLKDFCTNGYQFKDKEKVFELGQPSNLCLNAGIPSLPIVVIQSAIKKALGQANGKQDVSHCLTINDIMDLPDYIQNPILVMESESKEDSIVLVTEIIDINGQTVMAVIHLNKSLGVSEVNLIPTIYSRP